MRVDELKRAITEKDDLLIQLKLAKQQHVRDRIISLATQAAEMEGRIAEEHLRQEKRENAIVHLISQSSCLVDADRTEDATKILETARSLTTQDATQNWIDTELNRLRQTPPSGRPLPSPEAGTIDSPREVVLPGPAPRDSRPGASERWDPIFPTTHWTTLLQPINQRTDQAQLALSALLQIYRQPIVNYTRTLVRHPQHAEDIAHDFIARLLVRGDLSNTDRAKGRFRSYLAISIKHYVISHYVAEDAKKRKDLRNASSLDDMVVEIGHPNDAEKEFTRQWWRATIDEGVRRLRAEWEQVGKGSLFDDLEPLLWDKKDGPSIQGIAAKHAMTPNAVSLRKLRLLQRYQQILFSVIRETVPSAREVQDEIRYLLQDP